VRGVGRVDTDSSKAGYAAAAATAFAIGRVDGATIVATARTRVLPIVAVAVEALPTTVQARSSVLSQPSAAVPILAQSVEATSTPLLDIIAASRLR
jgi:hypothetical protein